MSLSCGIIGLPNVGKSTLFQALTNLKVEAYNYPFCTISPNVGDALVRDSRLDVLANIVPCKKIVPPTVKFIDIAGLVRGASKGEGLGNRFLADIGKVDAIIQVVRCFADESISYIDNRFDPLNDIKIISEELILADLEHVEKILTKMNKKSSFTNERESSFMREVLNRAKSWLYQIKPLHTLNLSTEEKLYLNRLDLLSIKPILYVANIAENDSSDQYIKLVEKYLAENSISAHILAISAKLEVEISEFPIAEKITFLKELNLDRTGLERMISAAYNLLDLHTFFTVGPKEIRGWTIKKKTTAIDAAAKIHTDIARGFIVAQIISYEDFVNCNGAKKAREIGKLRLEGRDYIINDGDITHFRFNI